jgi:hypothetical protein
MPRDDITPKSATDTHPRKIAQRQCCGSHTCAPRTSGPHILWRSHHFPTLIFSMGANCQRKARPTSTQRSPRRRRLWTWLHNALFQEGGVTHNSMTLLSLCTRRVQSKIKEKVRVCNLKERGKRSWQADKWSIILSMEISSWEGKLCSAAQLRGRYMQERTPKKWAWWDYQPSLRAEPCYVFLLQKIEAMLNVVAKFAKFKSTSMVVRLVVKSLKCQTIMILFFTFITCILVCSCFELCLMTNYP